MIIRHIYYSFVFLISIWTLIKQVSSCPIPFDIQSKCRCAITETGRVYIYCARKQLIAIPRFNTSNIIFDELVLSGNRISHVHKNAFHGLKLRKLEFQSNPIVTIESNAFIDLANYLEELIFSTTLLSSELTTDTMLQILLELPNLKRLSLRSFNLSNAFPNQNFLILRKLTQLSLQSCLIKQIDDVDNFVNLFPNLERLDLSENRLDYLNIPLILSLKKLKILNLSKNKIRHLNLHPSASSSTFHPSNSLLELDLSYNGIETIDEHIFELISSQLEILNLRNNELVTEKHMTFLIHLYHLREFYFDYNRLESINQLYLPLNLQILSLKHNRLNYINLSILTRLGRLEKLYLSSNKLTQWSSTMNNIFPSLEILELDRNHLITISSFNAPKLKQFNLDGNFLGNQIDRKIFANLPNLERVQLRDNQIEIIDSNAFRSTRLQSLDLTNNSLTVIPLLNNLNETLQILSLRRNQICTIDRIALEYYRNLHTLELEQNPLHCDCRLGENIVNYFRTKTKFNGQCQSPPERRNFELIELSNDRLPCSFVTLPQCTHLIKTEQETTTTTTSTSTIPTTTSMNIIEELLTNAPEQTSTNLSSTIEETPMERIRIADLNITPINDKSQLFIQWDLYPLLNDEHSNEEFRRTYLKNHHIHGFKISSTSIHQPMSELLDVLQRNYTIQFMEEGEICLLLLRKIDYEKFCKQIQYSPTPRIPTQTFKSPRILDSEKSSPIWSITEPTKSILIGSIFGILLVLILLLTVMLLITRCPYFIFSRIHTPKYHQNNDSKSETLLVRPTPTNTIPWSSPPVSIPSNQQHCYHRHHQGRPISYQASLSTQCTCPTHYHSSGSSSTDASTNPNVPAPNYHIYQEILNDDFNCQTMSNHYRTCRPLHIDTNSPPTSISTNTTTTTNPEQCQLCSLSVLV